MCVAATPVDDHSMNLEPRNCVGGDLPKQPLGDIQSNELEISSTSLAP
jgi:hypothetical protein